MKAVNYDLSVIIFIDILGFGRFVENAGSPRRVHDLLTLMQKRGKPAEDLAEEHEIQFTNFSDSVVRSTNILSDSNKKFPHGVLFYELLDLLHLQINCVGQGILVRGGLCIGDIYHGDDCVFGPGLNRAYKLENNVAEYPRVVVEESTLQHLKEPLMRPFRHDYEKEREYVENLLRKTNNGRYFVDYLRVAQEEM